MVAISSTGCRIWKTFFTLRHCHRVWQDSQYLERPLCNRYRKQQLGKLKVRSLVCVPKLWFQRIQDNKTLIQHIKPSFEEIMCSQRLWKDASPCTAVHFSRSVSAARYENWLRKRLSLKWILAEVESPLRTLQRMLICWSHGAKKFGSRFLLRRKAARSKWGRSAPEYLPKTFVGNSVHCSVQLKTWSRSTAEGSIWLLRCNSSDHGKASRLLSFSDFSYLVFYTHISLAFVQVSRGSIEPQFDWLLSGLPSPTIQRSLKLIAKVIQSLANLNTV